MIYGIHLVIQLSCSCSIFNCLGCPSLRQSVKVWRLLYNTHIYTHLHTHTHRQTSGHTHARIKRIISYSSTFSPWALAIAVRHKGPTCACVCVVKWRQVLSPCNVSIHNWLISGALAIKCSYNFDFIWEAGSQTIGIEMGTKCAQC